ncbi:hypothetical protein [Micromonospora sp. NBC_01412]|uniref:hypothetical protein n=1 Tax=Micromonospora sp. NBC_01412 TaxID=2903590 RepID=UPI0032486FFC
MALAEHLLDSGYVTPETVHRASMAHGITIIGPVRQGPRAVERPGFAKEDFHVDWRAETVTCPQGTVSPRWKPMVADGEPRLSVLFRTYTTATPVDASATSTARSDTTANSNASSTHQP